MIEQRYYKAQFENNTIDAKYITVPKDAPELIECPCCGGKAVYKSLHAIWVECTVCGLSTPAYRDIHLVARAWNGAIQAVEVTNAEGEIDASIANTDTDRSKFTRDGAYNGLLSMEEIQEALRLKASRAAGKPILVRPRRQKEQPKRPRGRPRLGISLVPKYTPTGRPPGRPRKNPEPEDNEN